MGHDVRAVGVKSELAVLGEAIERFQPHICFNLVEDFDGIPSRDQHVVSYLELINQSYTGCNPRGLTLSRDKSLTKKILAYHGINVPRFAVFPAREKYSPGRSRWSFHCWSNRWPKKARLESPMLRWSTTTGS